ncbi:MULTISPECIES: hypothetical protein [unclassified Lentimicrobium]|uniref:hypothetical protein n=1 Tax=unclassified Lentimicrobium TaxID=2677434 RepID=UPI0015529BBB|nr:MULTISPECIES: hypothetical protein [unclassified Lentimicrobium]NPD46117.1 hypothetical protein [Lentimicrobium sp. S6]NPD86467.1 hypothetical protein [Lentimicrobium sp. L6]
MESNKTMSNRESNENPNINEFLDRKELENRVLKKLLLAIEKDQEKKSQQIKKSI